MPLVPNYESVDKSTYPHFKNPCVQPVAENKAEFVLVKYHFFNMLQYPCVRRNLQKYQEA